MSVMELLLGAFLILLLVAAALGTLAAFGLLPRGWIADRRAADADGPPGGSKVQVDLKCGVERQSYLLSQAETRFLEALDLAVAALNASGGPRLRVTTKVRLGDLVRPARGSGRGDAVVLRNRVNQKHLDFVVFEANPTRIVCGVELDDSSHDTDKSKARDGFVEAVCGAAGMPLLRVRAAASYSPDQIAGQLRAAAGLRAGAGSA
jgi:hypothetical protein